MVPFALVTMVAAIPLYIIRDADCESRIMIIICGRVRLAVAILISLILPFIFGAIQSTCKENGQVALTFDFGPGSLTGKLLDILFEYKIPATFHVTVDLFRNLTLTEYVRRAHAEGHTIGILVPETGPWMTMETLPEDDPGFVFSVIQQVTLASNWITSITGSQPRYIRFATKKAIPIGIRRSLEQQLGLTITKPKAEVRDETNKMDSIWNSLGKTFAQATPSANSFILRQRDGMSNSIASVPRIVEFLKEKGYSVVPMTECVPPRPVK